VFRSFRKKKKKKKKKTTHTISYLHRRLRDVDFAMSTALLLLGLVQAATALLFGANPTLQRCRIASPAMMADLNKDIDVRRRSSPLPDGPAQGGERRHNSAC